MGIEAAEHAAFEGPNPSRGTDVHIVYLFKYGFEGRVKMHCPRPAGEDRFAQPCSKREKPRANSGWAWI